MQSPVVFLGRTTLHFSSNHWPGEARWRICKANLTMRRDFSTAPPQPDALPARAARLCKLLDSAAGQGAPLAVRFACLTLAAAEAHPQPEAQAQAARIAQRWKVPADCRELAELLVREAARVLACDQNDAEGLMATLTSTDAFRRPERLLLLMQACELHAQAQGHAGSLLAASRLAIALAAANTVDSGLAAANAAASGLRGAAIGHAVREARVAAIHTQLKARPPL